MMAPNTSMNSTLSCNGRLAMRWCRLTTNSSGGTLNSVSSPRRTTSQNRARASGDSLSIRPAISSSIISSKGRGPGHPEGYPGPLATYAVTGWGTDRLYGGDVVRLHALLALGSLVRDLGALIEALEAVTRNACVVHEKVLATLIRGDEAVALLVVEPLYRSLGHIWSPPSSSGAPPQQKSRSSHLRAALHSP